MPQTRARPLTQADPSINTSLPDALMTTLVTTLVTPSCGVLSAVCIPLLYSPVSVSLSHL